MSLSADMLSIGWGIILGVFCLALSGFAFMRIPWRLLADNRALQHLLGGATALLILMWSMRAGVSPGLSIHFLGLTALTLVVGWDLALFSGVLALLAMTLIGKESWDGFFVNMSCVVVAPVLTSHFICRWVTERLPHNFFIYLFVAGFGGAAVATAVSGIAMSSILWLDGVYSFEKIMLEYLRYLPLIMFPEGLMNGILMTGIMVFHPDWIRTFDATSYIDNQ